MIKKNCFVKEKGKKESLPPGACSLIAKKQRNKRWYFAWLSVTAAAQICVYAGIFLRT